MSEPSNLRRLFRGLEALYGSEFDLEPLDHLLPGEPGATRERVLFREQDGALEVGLWLAPALLDRFERAPAHAALAEPGLGNTLPIIEGLSHLLYLAESARRERPVSGLELETQAEVDKLAIHVLHRWPLESRRFRELVDRLYYRFSWVPDMPETLLQRYRTANRIALAFARSLERDVDERRLENLKRRLRTFWGGGMADKRQMAA